MTYEEELIGSIRVEKKNGFCIEYCREWDKEAAQAGQPETRRYLLVKYKIPGKKSKCLGRKPRENMRKEGRGSKENSSQREASPLKGWEM